MTPAPRGPATRAALESAPGRSAEAATRVSHDTPLREGISAIWVRELRGRMRGRRAFVFITLYLLLLVGVLWLALRGVEPSPVFGAMEQVNLGRGIFAAVVLIETLVVVGLAPPYTAGAISQEREKQTFDLLAVTPVSSLSIVLGKLMSGLSYLALIVGVSIPIASVAFLLGGVAPESLVLAYAVLAVTAVGVGAIGVACSAVMRRTQPATVAAFVVVALLVVGFSAVWAVSSGRAQARGEEPPPRALLYLNPFLAQADLLCAQTGTACIGGLTDEPPGRPPVVMGGGAVGDGPEIGDGPGLDDRAGEGPANDAFGAAGGLWPMSVLAWLATTAIAVAVASRALRRGGLRAVLPARRAAPVPRTEPGP